MPTNAAVQPASAPATPQRVRHCGRCEEAGHNATICPKPPKPQKNSNRRKSLGSPPQNHGEGDALGDDAPVDPGLDEVVESAAEGAGDLQEPVATNIHAPLPDSAHCSDQESQTKEEGAKHCVRCHAWVMNQGWPHGSCIVPHVFSEQLRDAGDPTSGHPSICCGGKFTATSAQVSKGLYPGFCFQGRHTSNTDIVEYPRYLGSVEKCVGDQEQLCRIICRMNLDDKDRILVRTNHVERQIEKAK